MNKTTLIPQKSVWLVNYGTVGGRESWGEESRKGWWRGSCYLWPVVRWKIRVARFGASSLWERGAPIGPTLKQ